MVIVRESRVLYDFFLSGLRFGLPSFNCGRMGVTFQLVIDDEPQVLFRGRSPNTWPFKQYRCLGF